MSKPSLFPESFETNYGEYLQHRAVAVLNADTLTIEAVNEEDAETKRPGGGCCQHIPQPKWLVGGSKTSL